MKNRVRLFALTAALLAAAYVAGNVAPAASTIIIADGGPILVCPPGKTHDACTKNNPLPPGGGL